VVSIPANNSWNYQLIRHRLTPPPQDLIRDFPSQAALHRILQAVDISINVDDRSFLDLLDELSQIKLGRAASQLRFAGARTVYYYRIDGLCQISPDGATGRVGDVGSPGAYEPEAQTALRNYDRIYIVCNVPDTGSQTQLTISKENRPTTIATSKPKTQLLAVRAPDEGTADTTAQAVLNYLELDNAARISFLNTGFRDGFENTCVKGYSTLRLTNTNSRDSSKETEVRSKESERGRIGDIDTDTIVEDLLQHEDIEINEATGLVDISSNICSMEHDEPLHPRVTIGFIDGWVTFDQFVPEKVLIQCDNTVRSSV